MECPGWANGDQGCPKVDFDSNSQHYRSYDGFQSSNVLGGGPGVGSRHTESEELRLEPIWGYPSTSAILFLERPSVAPHARPEGPSAPVLPPSARSDRPNDPQVFEEPRPYYGTLTTAPREAAASLREGQQIGQQWGNEAGRRSGRSAKPAVTRRGAFNAG